MGTSRSSSGPGPGVPLVPPWVPDVPAEPPVPPAPPPPSDEEQLLPSDGGPQMTEPPPPTIPMAPIPLAPSARFLGARRSLGDFARSGDADDMRRGFGRYVRSGYNGAATIARRMGGTAVTAGALHGALSNIAAGQPAAAGSPLDPVLLAGSSADAVMNAVVEAVRPVDGTQDTEAARAAIRDALSELLTRYPDADFLNLDAEQREFAIERYTALDVFRRFDLDIGQTIRDKAPNASTGLSRLKQARDYVKETVAAAFRRLREAGRAMTAGRVSQIVRDALRETFQVFEGYAE